MGDSAQGQESRDQKAASGEGFGSSPKPSGNNFQTQRARGRAGQLRGKGNAGRPEDSFQGQKPRSNISPKTVKVMDSIKKRGASTSKTGNDPAKKQDMRSRPSASEKVTGKDAGHRNLQK